MQRLPADLTSEDLSWVKLRVESFQLRVKKQMLPLSLNTQLQSLNFFLHAAL